MNSPNSKIKHAYWLLYQLKKLHQRYRFRKMMLMMIPFTLIVGAYLGIQFKDLYQLKYLKISQPEVVAEEKIEEESLEKEIKAPKVDLASNRIKSTEEFAFTSPNDSENSQSTEETFDLFSDESAEVEQFVSGHSENAIQNREIIKIDLQIVSTSIAVVEELNIPSATPSLLTFKPVPYVRIPSEDLLSEVILDSKDVPYEAPIESEGQ